MRKLKSCCLLCGCRQSETQLSYTTPPLLVAACHPRLNLLIPQLTTATRTSMRFCHGCLASLQMPFQKAFLIEIIRFYRLCLRWNLRFSALLPWCPADLIDMWAVRPATVVLWKFSPPHFPSCLHLCALIAALRRRTIRHKSLLITTS